MSLTTGGYDGIPEGWGIPAPVYIRNFFGFGRYRTGGMVWLGKRPAREQDIRALKEALGENVGIDQDSLVGKDNPKYTTFSKKHDKPFRVRLG